MVGAAVSVCLTVARPREIWLSKDSAKILNELVSLRFNYVMLHYILAQVSIHWNLQKTWFETCRGLTISALGMAGQPMVFVSMWVDFLLLSCWGLAAHSKHYLVVSCNFFIGVSSFVCMSHNMLCNLHFHDLTAPGRAQWWELHHISMTSQRIQTGWITEGSSCSTDLHLQICQVTTGGGFNQLTHGCTFSRVFLLFCSGYPKLTC